MNSRPTLDRTTSVEDFKDFYWLKAELIHFCRKEGLKTTGSKIEISKRIERYLSTGETDFPDTHKKKKPSSDFDWKHEALTLETVITDNYSSTENVRVFFQHQIGSHFKFNVIFMSWMKANAGKTLKDAIGAWRRIHSEKKNATSPKKIAPQFEYNAYLRDFLADNPGADRSLGIRLWNIKKMRRGDNRYHRDDLALIEGDNQ